MKSTGIVRKVDELGRIVLPIELRRTLDIAEKDCLEIYMDGESIVLKKYQPACLINSRLGNIEDGTDKYKFDYRSWGDNEIPDEYMKDGLFESPATLNDTWGYKAYDQNWKSAEEVKRIKEHLNSRGINYLLNVGPDPLGRFPAAAQDVLKALAK